MDITSLKESLDNYNIQLNQINEALLVTPNGPDKENLISLQNDIKQLIDLTSESLIKLEKNDNNKDCRDGSSNDVIQDEYALFMAEMAKEGAISRDDGSNKVDVNKELKSLEGMKCRAPHTHNWGDTVYHNAMVCSIVSTNNENYQDIEVRVMYINPTHQEMLPCPYYLETDCKFTEEKCKYSHGEIVTFSSLQEYVEPKFELLKIGSPVLAKHASKLWHRATIKKIFTDKCVVKFDSSHGDMELEFHDILPLENDEIISVSDESEDELSNNDDVINMSLMCQPLNQGLGEWEQYTKGIGSKLMQKMGYVVGTGLGRYSDGRLDPVTAVILPAGKSLDHCMQLRENSGGDKDLFSVERKLKRLQKRQEIQNKKVYERELKKVDMFKFLNNTLSTSKTKENADFSKCKHREEIKKETSRELNVASLKIEEDIKRIERELYKIKESLVRHSDKNSQIHKNLKMKLTLKQNELKTLQTKALNISNEQSTRHDKKKLTIF